MSQNLPTNHVSLRIRSFIGKRFSQEEIVSSLHAVAQYQTPIIHFHYSTDMIIHHYCFTDIITQHLAQEWDDELAAVAQRHADQCVFDHDCAECR